MADLFFKNDAQNVLRGKTVLLFGCSNMRALYKDIVWLLNQSSLINNNFLTKKLEPSYQGDSLISNSTLTKSRYFVEQRLYKKNNLHLEFHFITRCCSEILTDILRDIKKKRRAAPDVILINSCLWDLTRWGPNGVDDYKKNMVEIAELFKESLPLSTMLIWSTALPVDVTIKGGLIIKQVKNLQASLRFHIMEANLFTANLIQSYGFDVLDFHYYIHFQVSRRSCDGVHFLPLPLRMLTNLFLTHLALSWGNALPNRQSSLLLEKEIVLSQKENNCFIKTKKNKNSANLKGAKLNSENLSKVPLGVDIQNGNEPSSSVTSTFNDPPGYGCSAYKISPDNKPLNPPPWKEKNLDSLSVPRAQAFRTNAAKKSKNKNNNVRRNQRAANCVRDSVNIQDQNNGEVYPRDTYQTSINYPLSFKNSYLKSDDYCTPQSISRSFNKSENLSLKYKNDCTRNWNNENCVRFPTAHTYSHASQNFTLNAPNALRNYQNCDRLGPQDLGSSEKNPSYLFRNMITDINSQVSVQRSRRNLPVSCGSGSECTDEYCNPVALYEPNNQYILPNVNNPELAKTTSLLNANFCSNKSNVFQNVQVQQTQGLQSEFRNKLMPYTRNNEYTGITYPSETQLLMKNDSRSHFFNNAPNHGSILVTVNTYEKKRNVYLN